jgi:hypothetical protein
LLWNQYGIYLVWLPDLESMKEFFVEDYSKILEEVIPN